MAIGIGSSVYCVDDSIPSHLDMEAFKKDFPQWVKKDKKYTIREILENDGIVVSVLLEELKNPIRFFPNTIGRFQESSFRITRFREAEPNKVTENVSEKALELIN